MPAKKEAASGLSIDQKLSLIKSAIGSISKDKVNPFAKSRYSSLSYIIAQVRPVMASHGIDFQIISWTLAPPKEGMPVHYRALVKVVDLETGEYELCRYDINLDTAQANKVQAFGATMTYGRRYIYAVLFDLEYDDDDPDSKPPTPDKKPVVQVQDTAPKQQGKTLIEPPKTTPIQEALTTHMGAKPAPAISESQRKRLFAITKEAGLTNDQLKKLLQDNHYGSTSDITTADYEEVCAKVQELGRKVKSMQSAQGELE